jgi:hypothetical protein
LCRFIKALLTYIPGMLIGVLTVMGRPHTNNAGDAPKYTHAMVFFGKVYCFHEHKSALYHWLKYFNEFVAYDQPVHDAALSAQKDDQGAAKNSVNWPQFLNKCFKALWWLAIVYLVVSIFFPPLLGLNVAAGTAATFGGWLLAHIGISAAAHTGVYVSLGICAVFNPSSFGYMGALLNPAYRNDLASQKNTVLNLVSKKLSNNTKLYSECQSLCQELSPAVQQPSDPCQPMNYQDACDVLSTHRYKWGHSSSNTRTYRFFKKVESVFGQQTVKDWFTPKSSTSV